MHAGRPAGPEEYRSAVEPAARATGPLRVGGGLKIAAGGAPAGSRLAAMVGDDDYYQDPPSPPGRDA